jgi:hypothetical protein
MKYIMFLAVLLMGCEPPPEPPCREVKLGTFTTKSCPHSEHVLEEHMLKPSVCRCKKSE